MATTYWEKLKDPRGQKKRLEIMQDREFKCEMCGDDETSLNVHHKEYFKGHEPWEYENNQLAVICENCHKAQHDNLDILKWVCSQAGLDGPCNRDELATLLAGYMKIDYEGFLTFTGLEDHEYIKRIYGIGQAARKAEYEMV